MKKLAALFFLAVGCSFAQTQWSVQAVTVAPTGSCGNASLMQQVVGTGLYQCISGTWTNITGGGAATSCPGCATTGDVTGTLSTTKVVGLSSAAIYPNYAVVYAANQTGADASIKINACITKVIAAGGGTCDARGLGGSQAMSQELEVGTVASNLAAIGVTVLFPVNATWTWSGITDGVSCGVRQFGRTQIIGTTNGGGASTMNLTAANGSSMDSLYCVDPTTTGIYVRAEGFRTVTGSASTAKFVWGHMHIRNVDDQSFYKLIQTSNQTGDGWSIENACCGTTFDQIQADAGTSGGGGYPMKIGGGTVLFNAVVTSGQATVTVPYANLTAQYLGQTVTATNIPGGTTVLSIQSATSFTMSANATGSATETVRLVSTIANDGAISISIRDATLNSPGIGFPNLMIAGNSNTGPAFFYNLYEESNSTLDSVTPMNYIDVGTSGVSVFGGNMTCCSNPTGKYAFENHSANPFSVFSLQANTGINDVANGTTLGTTGGTVKSILNYSTNLSEFPGQVGGSSARMFSAVCNGTFPSSESNGAEYALGTTGTTCSGTSTSNNAIVMTGSGTLSNLTVTCGTTGVNTSSGVFTLWDAPSGGSATNTPITVTYGTTTAGVFVQDSTHTYSYSPGDRITLHIATQGSETLASCSVSFNY